jgi:hypothetical protein
MACIGDHGTGSDLLALPPTSSGTESGPCCGVTASRRSTITSVAGVRAATTYHCSSREGHRTIR